MRPCFLLIFIVAVMSVFRVAMVSAHETIIDARGWNFYPLEFSQLVIVGVIVDVRDDRILGSDLYMLPEGEKAAVIYKPAKRVRLNVKDVLRGSAQPGSHVDALIAMFDKDFDTEYTIGDTVLLGLNWHPRLQALYLKSSYGKYLERDGAWECEVPSNGSRALSDHEIRKMVLEMDIEHVTRDADLIVVGKVKSANEKQITADDGSLAMMMTVALEVSDLRKGEYGADEISFHFLTRGFYWPGWRKEAPRGFKAGQTWYAYLKQDDAGWYPFAGSNGLFRLDGDRLTYEAFDTPVPFWHPKDRVDRLTVMEMEGHK